MAAPAPTRALWKGSISFGLVFIPISLHSATVETRPKMRMLDADTGGPIGYQKVDKTTGETVSQAEVVKGVEVDRGEFVTLSKDEIREALPKTTQTIEIEAFVKPDEIPSVYFNKPYLTSPTGKAGKVYALLREVLRRTGRVGVGRIVVSTKQHLALVVPYGDGLVINLLRWHGEIRDQAGLPLPGDAKEMGIKESELKMASSWCSTWRMSGIRRGSGTSSWRRSRRSSKPSRRPVTSRRWPSSWATRSCRPARM